MRGRMVRAGMIGLAIAAGVLASASAALGQEEIQPPVPSNPETPKVYLHLGVGVLLVALTIVASLIPSKRGHQD